MKKIYKLKEKGNIIKRLLAENEEVASEIKNIKNLNLKKLNDFVNLTRPQLISWLEYSVKDKNFVEKYCGASVDSLRVLELFEAIFILRIKEFKIED